MDVNSQINMYLEKIENELDKKIPKKPEQVFPGVEEYIKRGGKRIRPLFMLAVSDACGKDSGNLLDYAVIIELFHNFTLMHDDIEDGSKLRRGKPTLHEQYGTPLALNTGDALYTRIWQMVLEKAGAEEAEKIKEVSRAFLDVVTGQGIEIYWISNELFNVKEKEYFEMVTGKTASLLATCIKIGAINANYKRKEEIFQAGIRLGLAFQIIDDYLNLFGNQAEYGKTIGDDITEGKRSLMVIKALELLSGEDASKLIEILKMHTEDENLKQEAINLIKKSEADIYAKNLAEKLYLEAFEELSLLPESKTKELVLKLAESVVKREK